MISFRGNGSWSIGTVYLYIIYLEARCAACCPVHPQSDFPSGVQEHGSETQNLGENAFGVSSVFQGDLTPAISFLSQKSFQLFARSTSPSTAKS